VKKSNRRVFVFITLVSVLTLTSALLLALAPAPLRPDVSNSLFAIDRPETMEVIFQTQASVKPNRWKYIYIHHSRTPTGNALNIGPTGGAMPDHFVIGNGDGAVDGQIQVGPLWDQQTSANPPAGAEQINSQCISICMVGDFDHGVPTQMQLRRLTNLVNALQGRLDIPSGQVLLMSQPSSAAGAGKYFPTQAFRETLLP
jgi:hypothetical protein